MRPRDTANHGVPESHSSHIKIAVRTTSVQAEAKMTAVFTLTLSLNILQVLASVSELSRSSSAVGPLIIRLSASV